MTAKVFTDRSRILEYQSCPRRRWLAYHEAGTGISSAKKPLPLAVGGAVHVGLASLLQSSMVGDPLAVLPAIEQEAVATALADFAAYAGALELDLYETTIADGTTDAADLGGQLAASLGMSSTDAGLAPLAERVGRAKSEFDQFLYAEQSALVEGMVRAYARRRLRPLLEQYEVLEVEREGSWLLSEWYPSGAYPYKTDDPLSLWFMSRPDALLLERDTRQLSILSFKTAATWDVRKERDAQHDMQGLSEGVEVERRLAEWWPMVKTAHPGAGKDAYGYSMNSSRISRPMFDYLLSCQSAPRIHAIRYEFLLKGQRRRDKDVSTRLGLDVHTQSSPLTRAYRSAGMVAGDEAWNWSYDYLKETGETSKLYWKA